MDVSIDSLEKARNYLKENNFGRAFAHYLVVLQLIEVDRKSFYEEFKLTYLLWQDILFERQNYQNLISCFELANNFFLKIGMEELNEKGVKLLRSNHLIEALSIFEALHKKIPNFLPAEQNLWSTKYGLIERWHFRMLNDVIRNQSYYDAIKIELSKRGHQNIVDIGTGSGILSIFTAKNLIKLKNTKIIACDSSEIMIKIAKKITELNETEQIILLNEHSTNLPKMEKFSLVVTEIIDSGIFGECIIQTLIHAWDNLLTSNAKVIPSHAEIYIGAISSPKISSKFRLNPKITTLNLNKLCITYNSELYDTENLKKTKYNFVSTVQKCLVVDFNDPVQLKMLLGTYKNNPEITLTCTCNGEIDSFAIWFKLFLNDTIFLTNDPQTTQNSCWEQAIINLTHPIKFYTNDTIQFKVSCVDGVLKICELKHNFNSETFELLEIPGSTRPQLNQNQSLHSNVELSKSKDESKIPKLDLTDKDHIFNLDSNGVLDFQGHKCFNLEKSEIVLLNDVFLLSTIEKLSRKLSVTNKNVLDLTSIPIFGLLCLKNGAKVFCNIRNSMKSLVKAICDLNSLDYTKIVFLTENNFRDLNFEVMFQMNLIENTGVLNENEIKTCTNWLNYLEPNNGIYLPRNIFIWAQIIYSDWLENVTKVRDENCCGLRIAEIINDYKTFEQRDLDVSSIKYTEFSSRQKIGSVNFDTTKPFENKLEIEIIKNGYPNAILYWFEINIHENETIFTNRDESFASVSAFMIENPKCYRDGEKIMLNLKQHEGLLKINICDSS